MIKFRFTLLASLQKNYIASSFSILSLQLIIIASGANAGQKSNLLTTLSSCECHVVWTRQGRAGTRMWFNVQCRPNHTIQRTTNAFETSRVDASDKIQMPKCWANLARDQSFWACNFVVSDTASPLSLHLSLHLYLSLAVFLLPFLLVIAVVIVVVMACHCCAWQSENKICWSPWPWHLSLKLRDKTVGEVRLL